MCFEGCTFQIWPPFCKWTINCANHDSKMCKIPKSDQLPILLINSNYAFNFHDRFKMIKYLSRRPLITGLAFSITKKRLRILEHFVFWVKCTVIVHVDISIPQCTGVSGKLHHWNRNTQYCNVDSLSSFPVADRTRWSSGRALTWRVGGCGLSSHPGQTKDFKNGIWCFLAKCYIFKG